MRNVLLVVDTIAPSWAWAHMMEGLRKHSPADYRVGLCDGAGLRKLIKQDPGRLEALHGILHCSWTECPTDVLRKAAPKAKITTLLASHGFEFPFPPDDPNDLAAGISTPLRNIVVAKARLPRFDALLCVSDRIWRSARNMFRKAEAVRMVPGVDLDVFRPAPLSGDGPLRVGWCGQKPTAERNNTKGYREVLLPLMERLGHAVQWQINGRSASDALSQSEMVRWYQGIDVLLSTSSSEGCQMPLLEAAAMGRAVIATDVGAAAELIDGNRNDMACGARLAAYRACLDAPAVADTAATWISGAFQDRKFLSKCGQAARARVEEHFSWAKRAPEWLELIGG